MCPGALAKALPCILQNGAIEVPKAEVTFKWLYGICASSNPGAGGKWCSGAQGLESKAWNKLLDCGQCLARVQALEIVLVGFPS